MRPMQGSDFKNKSPGLRPIGMLDLKCWSLVDLMDPPYRPYGHLGPHMPTVKAYQCTMEPWAIHFAIIFSLLF